MASSGQPHQTEGMSTSRSHTPVNQMARTRSQSSHKSTEQPYIETETTQSRVEREHEDGQSEMHEKSEGEGAATPHRQSTLKKKSSIVRKNSLRRSGSRRSTVGEIDSVNPNS